MMPTLWPVQVQSMQWQGFNTSYIIPKVVRGYTLTALNALEIEVNEQP